MRILIISDVHFAANNLLSCLKKEENNVDAVIFTGDGIDIVEDMEYNFNNLKFYKVSGNTDFFFSHPREKIIVLMGYKIFITHGNLYGVKSTLGTLKNEATKLEMDIVIYGHTHISAYEVDNGIHYINSGSVSKERILQKGTYFIMTLDEKIKVEKFVI